MQNSSLLNAHRGVAAIFVLNGGLIGAWAARIPDVKHVLHLDESTLGLLLLLLAGGAIASFPFAGYFSDRFGAAVVSKALVILYVFSLIGIAASAQLWQLALALFIFGAVHGGMDVAMNTWGAEIEQKREKPIMSGLHAMFSIGAGVGAGSGAAASSFEISVLSHFVLFGVVMGAGAIFFTRSTWPRSDSQNRNGRLFFAIPKGSLALVGVIAFCSAVGEGAVADWSAVYLVDVLKATTAQGALGYAFFSIAMVAARLMGDSVIENFGRKRTARFSGATAAAGALVAVLAPNIWVNWLGFVLMGAGYALIFPMAFSRAANDPRMTPGAAMAATATLGHGGSLFGPPTIGFIAQASSLRVSFVLLVFLALLITAFATAMQQPPRKT